MAKFLLTLLNYRLDTQYSTPCGFVTSLNIRIKAEILKEGKSERKMFTQEICLKKKSEDKKIKFGKYFSQTLLNAHTIL